MIRLCILREIRAQVHAYYSDGSFQFDRSEESHGWVAQLVDRGTYIENRLIYVDVGEENAWGESSWAHNGRVGVLLRRQSDGSVLSVQARFPYLTFCLANDLPQRAIVATVATEVRDSGLQLELFLAQIEIHDRLPPMLVSDSSLPHVRSRGSVTAGHNDLFVAA